MLYRLCIYMDERIDLFSSKSFQREDLEIITIKAKKNLLNILSYQNCDMFILFSSPYLEPINDIITTLKNLPENPIVVLITELTKESIQKYYKVGCDAVLDKRSKTEKLKESILGIIDNHISQFPNFSLKNELNLQSDIKFDATPRLSDFKALNPVMQEFMRIVYKVSNSDTSLLIIGESGVGKERLARAIHSESQRAKEAFIPINCAALPDSLLESELFGHEQGAYTGATRMRRGAFELAHNGTIFLDEIGDMPLNLQVKLLRVLQERSFTRLGGEKNINVNIRIIAATNSDLKKLVDENKFRKDLYFRLGVVALNIPPLRERKMEIEILVKNYIEYFSKRIGTHVKSINNEALDALKEYDWPGNIRELINVIERAMLLAEGKKISLQDLPEEISNKIFLSKEDFPNLSFISEHNEFKKWKEYRNEILNYFENKYLVEVLKTTQGRISKTASIADIDTRSVYKKMKKHKLNKEDFK